MAIEITERDIGNAERVLLPFGRLFNEERRAFIRSMESRDVIACPGSGKTTALLAKLLILSKKPISQIGGGICVLTHTNVAIDEIKTRAGVATTSLFRYPNYFGTIQGFVNQFLATPWYSSEFKKPIVAVDNDQYYGRLGRIYSSDFGLKKWLDQRDGLTTLGNYWFHPQSEPLQVGENLDQPIQNLRSSTPTFGKIQAARMSVLEQGVLSFNDAYSFALRYCMNHPTLVKSIRERFKMVFIDEAQDTAEYQIRVLDQIFPFDKIIVQRIGDTNQAIFSSVVEKDCFWTPRQPLHFSDSQRFGRPISRILESVRVNDSIVLAPYENGLSVAPQIITFQNGQEQSVLKSFARLIEGVQDRISGTPTFKAIGWIGKRAEYRNDKLCIPSYYPYFRRFGKQKVKRFENMFSYCESAIQMAGTETLSEFSDIIFLGISHALNLAEIRSSLTGRSHTPTSIRAEWRHRNVLGYGLFRSRLAEGYLATFGTGLIPEVFRDEVKAAIIDEWLIANSDSRSFLNENNLTSELPPTASPPGNRIDYGSGICIDVATVHSVKGETHTATMFMETQYQRSTDACRLINFLKGGRPSNELQKAHHIQNLKVAHVAFSRPTLLLVFACRAQSIAGHEDGLRANGWEIHSVSELIPKGV